MAFSTQRAVSDGTLVLLGVSIGYIKQADISVFYNDLPAGAGTWNWVGNTSNIAFTPAVPNGVEVLLARTTQIDKVINRFSAGAGFTNQSMDTDFLQMLYLNQEAVEGAALTDIFNDVDFHGSRLTNIATAIASGDALPLGQYNTLAAQLTADVGVIKTQTEAVYDSFDDRYLGAKNVAPTLDNDGDALINGAVYFDTVIGGGSWRAWNAGAWVTLPAANASAVTNVPAGTIAATTVQAAIDELDATITALDAAKAPASAVPAGGIHYFPATIAPTGFVKANGALLSRTTYAALYAFALASGNMAASDGAWVSGQFSPGDGSTTFRIPDLRGYHLRSFDDGRGIDSGRAIGTVQADQQLAHNHTITDPGHSHIQEGTTLYFFGAGDVATGTGFPANTKTAATSPSATGITVNNSTGGAEVRIKNIALLACIKY